MSTDDTLDDRRRVANRPIAMWNNWHIQLVQLPPIVDHMNRFVIAMMPHLPHNHRHYREQSFDRMEPAMMNANLA